MLDYTGVKCPVCGAPFGKDDDIVVCPECGAPYHRECYHQVGKCIFEDLHRDGKEWLPPKPPKPPEPSAEVKDRECPVCGTLNAHSALFCSRCGASLLGDPQRRGGAGPAWTPPREPYAGPGASRTNAPPFSFDPMGGVSPSDVLDEGVTYGDASKLVKQNTNYYMPVFRYIKQSGRNKFSFSAFLFSGGWLLYRKQYKAGAVVTGLMFVLYALHLCLLCTVAYPTMLSMYAQAGIDLEQVSMLTSEQYAALSALLLENPSCIWRLMVPYLVIGLIVAVMIVIGVRGNRMYLEHCVRTARLVKAGDTGDDPTMTLDARGGVNVPVALCITVCYLLVRSLLPALLI